NPSLSGRRRDRGRRLQLEWSWTTGCRAGQDRLDAAEAAPACPPSPPPASPGGEARCPRAGGRPAEPEADAGHRAEGRRRADLPGGVRLLRPERAASEKEAVYRRYRVAVPYA